MGAAMEMRGFIEAYNKTFGKINIILTGALIHLCNIRLVAPPFDREPSLSFRKGH